ncbi:MAG TPA: hypothetical protein VGZ47_21125 [Gemmataceae bacterium]|nr:hypothetical protein [Gemmataceae bacterium]
MKRLLLFLIAGLGLCIVSGDVSGRGWGGGYRGGSFSGSYSGHSYGGGSYSGSYSHSSSEGWGHGYGSGSSSYSAEGRYGGSASGSRSTESSYGYGGRSGSSTYDHSWTGASGATASTSGTRSASEGRYGGYSASGSRDTSVTTAGGQTYSGSREGSYSGNRYTGYGSGSREGTASGPGGTASWQSAYSGNRYTGNMDHYASVYGANGAHSTAYWSSGHMQTQGSTVRSGFGYYNTFQPAYYTAHPGCWAAAGWGAGAAWSAPTYPAVAGYCGMAAAAPPDYDYGSSVVYQGDNVYMNGQDAGTTQQYAEQATTIASQGQTPNAPPTDDWKPLGVFALVQGDDKTSNYIFQLAVNKDGIIRGNYYDGVMDTNTEVFGSVDKKTQRAAWTIGKKKDRVFEAGIYNLTQPECPCLLHLGTQSTTQMMLVRVQQTQSGGSQPFTVISPQ